MIRIVDCKNEILISTVCKIFFFFFVSKLTKHWNSNLKIAQFLAISSLGFSTSILRRSESLLLTLQSETIYWMLSIFTVNDVSNYYFVFQISYLGCHILFLIISSLYTWLMPPALVASSLHASCSNCQTFPSHRYLRVFIRRAFFY